MEQHDLIDPAQLGILLSAPLSSEEPVVSLYLSNVGPLNERKLVLKNLVKQGEEAIRSDTGWDDERRKTAHAALGRAHSAAENALARGSARGTFAIFASRERTDSFRLPPVLRDRVVVDRTPYTSPLSTLLEQFEHYAVVLVDHKMGRLFDFFLGELRELETVTDPADARKAHAGFHGLDQTRMNNHKEYTLHRHFQHIADRLFAHHKSRAFEKLVLAGLPDSIAKLERVLHPYLRGRIVARESWAHDLPKDEVRRRTHEIERDLEAAKERKLLANVRDHVCSDLLATTGIDETLRALYHGKVATLVVSYGEARRGRECPECRYLFPRPEDAKDKSPTLVPCPLCQRPTRAVPDIIDEATELAILSGAKVENIEHAKDELTALGGVASILRFR